MEEQLNPPPITTEETTNNNNNNENTLSNCSSKVEEEVSEIIDDSKDATVILIVYNGTERLLEIPQSIFNDYNLIATLRSLFSIEEVDSSKHSQKFFFVNWNSTYQRESYQLILNTPTFLQSIPRAFHTELRVMLSATTETDTQNPNIDIINNEIPIPNNNNNNDNSNNVSNSNSNSSSNRGDEWQDNQYFTEYAELRIHTQMIADNIRNEAYYKAITQPELFKDKVVLDIGTGSGILSCFAALSGAKIVYAIEASDMWEKADFVVRRNGLENKIKIIHGMLEDIDLPEKVDIIVSEWMGAFLLFESMLNSVIVGRDRFLQPGGLLFPSTATMIIAPITQSRFFDRFVNNLKNVCNVNLSPLIPFAMTELTAKIRKAVRVRPEEVIAEPIKMASFDISTVTHADLEKIVSSFEFTVQKQCVFHGFVIYFEVSFPSTSEEKTVTLSNSPLLPATHWKNDSFLFTEGTPVSVGDSKSLSKINSFT